MLILAIDTASPTGSTALRNDSGLVALITVSVDQTHSEGLMPAVDDLFNRARLKPDDLTAVACVTGPGSYTGLRIGAAAAQGIAFANHLPCAAFTSLDVLAWSVPHAVYPVCPVLPARKGWLYARLYRWIDANPQPITDELYIKPDELITQIQEPTLIYGPGLNPYRIMLQEILGDAFVNLPLVFDSPRADILAELAARAVREGNTIDPEQLLPHYLGPSQAEINWKKRQRQRGEQP